MPNNINYINIIVIIPARGGSKGIPGKNIKNFEGKPLISHSIEYAQDSELINQIYVSTDDEQIAHISKTAGAKIIKRPSELATDTSTTESAIKHALNNIDKRPDIIVLLQPTSPLRPEKSLDIAINNNLLIIEDAAQSFGGRINNKKACSFGDIGTTSFFPAKPLGCYGDGGAVFTSDDDLAHILRSIRVHGGGADKYDNVRVGINGRLNVLQAAVLLEKLAIFPDEVLRRNRVAEYYTNNLPASYRAPIVPKNYLSSWAQYSILLETPQDRGRVIKKLKEQNIPAMIYYKISLHLQKVFEYLGYERGDFPVSEKTSENIFSIPMHPYIKTSEQDKILEALHAAT